ncbi:MAG: TolC family protein [Ignavibacteria bacterium]|nr:TolC family protein [Ignavibacteria bacterium]
MRNKIITVLLIIFITGISNAQEVKVYALRDAIIEAFKNNSELVNARHDLMKSQYKVTESYNEGLIPTLSLSSTYTRAFKKQVFDIFGQKFEIGTDNSITTALQLTQAIPFLGNPIFSGIRIAEYYRKLSEENILAIETKIATDVKKSFLNVLLLKDIVEVNKKALNNTVENLSIVEIRYRNGTVTEFDYLRAKVKVATIKPNLTQAENNLTLSKKSLKNTIGLKTDEEIDIVGSLIYDSTEFLKTQDEIIEEIASNNVNIRLLNISKDINSELIEVDDANFLPKLYLFGQYALTANENDGRSITRYRYYNAINAGIGLNWTFNLFTNPYKKQQSVLDLKKTDEQIYDLKEKLKIQASSILLRMEDAKNRIIAQNETVKLAERGYELAVTSFKSGVLNQIDVLDAELMLTQSRLALLQAIFDYQTAKSELEGLLEIK